MKADKRRCLLCGFLMPVIATGLVIYLALSVGLNSVAVESDTLSHQVSEQTQ